MSATGLAIMYKLVSDIKFILSTILVLGIDLSTQYALMKISTKLMKKSRLNSFKKKYPNIETDVDVNELDNALNKYKELLKSKFKEKEHYINIDVNKDINDLEKYINENKEVKKESSEQTEYIEDTNNFDKKNVKALKKTYNRNKQ